MKGLTSLIKQWIKTVSFPDFITKKSLIDERNWLTLHFITDQCALQQQLIELMPMVQEVNSIAREMEKNRVFDIVLMPPLLQGAAYGQRKTTK